MDKTTSRIVVTGYIKIASKDRETFLEVLRAHVPSVRKKDGCIAYAFAADVLDRDVVRMSELWRDLQSLEAHLGGKEFQEVLQELGHIEIIDRSVQRYETSSTTEI